MNKFKLTITAATILVSSQVFAQSSFLGLSSPKQETDRSQSVYNSSLEDLLSARIATPEKTRKSDVPEMRRQAITEIASALGASRGLSYRMNERRIEIIYNAANLDQTFDFTKVTIDNGVLAPVLTEGLSNYAQESDDQVRIADKIYKIEMPAKFVSVYPTWRSYLKFTYPSFESPIKAYLPQNDAEKIVWDEAVKEGWTKGVRQADNIVESSFNRLVRDYQGMIKYKILLAQGLITPTIIARQNFGVTGGGKEMAINDQVFRITDHSALNPSKGDWKVEYPVTNNQNGKLK